MEKPNSRPIHNSRKITILRINNIKFRKLKINPLIKVNPKKIISQEFTKISFKIKNL